MSRYQYEYSFEPFRERVTWAVQTLIIANILVFVGQLVLDVPFGSDPRLPPGGHFLISTFGFSVQSFLGLFLWQPLTYMFLHAGLLHLFMNMLWLYFFGSEVERLLGTRLFFRFYLACGVLGVLANFVPYLPAIVTGQAFIAPPVIGASGATMGILIAFAMINPERQFFLFPIPVPINARAMVGIVILLNLLQAANPDDNTSVATHFGGMLAGFVLMKVIPRYRSWQNERRQKRPPKQEPDDVGKAVDNIFRFDDRKRKR